MARGRTRTIHRVRFVFTPEEIAAAKAEMAAADAAEALQLVGNPIPIPSSAADEVMHHRALAVEAPEEQA